MTVSEILHSSWTNLQALVRATPDDIDMWKQWSTATLASQPYILFSFYVFLGSLWPSWCK